MPLPELTGIVEGFYGREWSWQVRHQTVDFLSRQGLNSYLYCPKGDSRLRKQWREPWPHAVFSELQGLAQRCRQRGILWGVGLSPFALYLEYGATERDALRRRVRQINDLGGALLAILFDDMPGDCPDLAARQAEIVADVQAWTNATRLLVCPTYYSYDPVLEHFFGPRPARYWECLGEALAAEVGLFWTGNRVCSVNISRRDLQAIKQSIGRAPVLWDNYPVNDGAKGSKYLNLAPLPGREPGLEQDLAGHFCNPMNQGLLSQYPLTGLAALYGAGNTRLEDLYSPALTAALRDDATIFQQQGLDQLDRQTREQSARRYAAMSDAAAQEVAGWLRGEYAFDPACLTG